VDTFIFLSFFFSWVDGNLSFFMCERKANYSVMLMSLLFMAFSIVWLQYQGNIGLIT
jgi:hypothetical protein